MIVAHPWVKWAGGKTALLSEIIPRFPPHINTYYEPFLGGGAVFFAMAAEKRFKRAVLGDVNQDLMRAYSMLASNPDQVIAALKTHVYEEKYYYVVRAKSPRELLPSEQAARLIYLNRTCYNGLYRVNRKGGFNVPFGRYTNPTICDEENLRAASEVLRDAAFVALDFKDIVAPAKEGDAVYFDPPYTPLSKTSNFTAYTAGGFTDDDQIRLRDVMVKLVEKKVYVLLSNADTPRSRELYKGFRIEEVQAPRRVNSKGGKRGNVGELLISGRV